MESNIVIFVSGKNIADIAGSEVSHVIQWHYINWGETAFSSSPPQKGGLMYKRYAEQSCKERKANGMQPVG